MKRILKRNIYDTLRNTPYLWRLAPRFIDRKDTGFISTTHYWEDRYAAGGTSGLGSTGNLARFKARVINDFVRNHKIETVIEFGCGDGTQLALASYENYLGLDVSETAIRMCREKFADDKTKKFRVYDPEKYSCDGIGLFADLTLSLDVIYHLIEDKIFRMYIDHLFHSAKYYVIIYSSDSECEDSAPHVRHRRFTPYLAKRFPEWKLALHIGNPYPFRPDDNKCGSLCEFFIFERRTRP